MTLINTLYEYYDYHNYDWYIFSAEWTAQTFTVGVAFTGSLIKLPLYREGTIGTVDISLRLVGADGNPSGSDISTGSMDGDTIVVYSPYGATWYEIPITQIVLNAGIKYAIVVRCEGADENNALYWYYDTDAGYLSGSYYYSGDSGSTWEVSNDDLAFRVYGLPLVEAPTDPPVTLTLYEKYITDDNYFSYFNEVDLETQTFRVAEAFTGSAVRAKMCVPSYNTANGLLWVYIKNTGSAGEPSGSDLNSGSLDTTGLTTDYSNPLWYEIQITPMVFEADVQYAIIFKTVDAGNEVNIRTAGPGFSSYPSGSEGWSEDAGETWNMEADHDNLFKVYGPPALGGIGKKRRILGDGFSWFLK